jgi:hypothetical protein
MHSGKLPRHPPRRIPTIALRSALVGAIMNEYRASPRRRAGRWLEPALSTGRYRLRQRRLALAHEYRRRVGPLPALAFARSIPQGRLWPGVQRLVPPIGRKK